MLPARGQPLDVEWWAHGSSSVLCHSPATQEPSFIEKRGDLAAAGLDATALRTPMERKPCTPLVNIRYANQATALGFSSTVKVVSKAFAMRSRKAVRGSCRLPLSGRTLRAVGAGQGRARPLVSNRYEVRIARRAAKSLVAHQRHDQQRIRAAIELLAEDPWPPACIAMSGEDSVYRVRVGDDRIVYEVIDDVLVIHVVRIAHLREVYR